MNSDKPEIQCSLVHPTLFAQDVRAAIDYYRDRLGFEVEFEYGQPPEHAGVRLGSASLHLTCDTPHPGGFRIYLVVDDVDALFAWYRGNGVTIVDEPETQPWGMREFEIRDLNGYVLRFGRHDPRAGDPLEVERVKLQARMEKRLAALLEDLAQHKGMTVGEALEETLLHSFETDPETQGAACPHTKTTLSFIESLKAKHRVDYAAHDGYRFKEK